MSQAECTQSACCNIDTTTQVHGNANAYNTQLNAARCLEAFGADPSIKIYPGATKPLIRTTRHDAEIHGVDGLGGVEGLPSGDDPRVQARLNSGVRAIEAIAQAVKTTWNNGTGERVFVISAGPMTNIALFVSVYPELLAGIGEYLLNRLNNNFQTCGRGIHFYGRCCWTWKPFGRCRYAYFVNSPPTVLIIRLPRIQYSL